MRKRKRTKRIHGRFISIQEDISSYRDVEDFVELIPDWEDYVIRIETIYWFNANEHHHLCEVTPSYLLIPIQTRAIYTWDVSEKITGIVDEFLNEQFDDDIIYRHVSDIDTKIKFWRISKRNPKINFKMCNGLFYKPSFFDICKEAGLCYKHEGNYNLICSEEENLDSIREAFHQGRYGI